MNDKKIRQKTKEEYEESLPNDPYWDCPCDNWNYKECKTCRGACSCHWIEDENGKTSANFE